jgi:hypothetical protein
MTQVSWLSAVGSKITLNLGEASRHWLAWVLVILAGGGSFAGSWFAFANLPVEVEQVSLNEQTVKAIVNETTSNYEHKISAILKLAESNEKAISVAEDRLSKSEELQLENLRLVNRLLGKLDTLEVTIKSRE